MWTVRARAMTLMCAEWFRARTQLNVISLLNPNWTDRKHCYNCWCFSTAQMCSKCNEIASVCGSILAVPLRGSTIYQQISSHRNAKQYWAGLVWMWSPRTYAISVLHYNIHLLSVNVENGPHPSPLSSGERACQLICIINSHRVAGVVAVSHFCMDPPQGRPKKSSKLHTYSQTDTTRLHGRSVDFCHGCEWHFKLLQIFHAKYLTAFAGP